MAEEEANSFNLTPVDFSRYFAYFHRITPNGEKLSGGRAREFFLQTCLSPKLLSHIWKLSDLDQDGCLSTAEFPLAMFLIQQSLKGVPLPLYLPDQLHTVYIQVVSPQLPVATDAHLGKCKKAFEAFRQNIGKGVLGGDAARYLLGKSNLSKEQLYHIWKLSDIDEDGHLTFKEFTVAMHLLFIAKLGYFLPVDLDPNTILPPSYHDIIRRVQAETERLPTVNSDHIPIQPFSPPATPIKPNPPLGENPFISDEFVNLPARKFLEGEFENFYGDPFESVETFTEPSHHPIGGDMYDGDSLRQQFQVNTGSIESISQESQTSQAHSSGMENEDSEPLEQHDYYMLEDPGQSADQAQSSELISDSRNQDPELSSHESVNLSQTSSVTESGSEMSSPNSKRSGRRLRNNKSSVESLQDVVVIEREEPVLQLAKSVDVIGSREVTPVPEEAPPTRWVSPGQVQAELEELSRASRKFLEESKSRLHDQQRRNLHVSANGGPHVSYGMDNDMKTASRKGLSATIQEMTEEEGGSTKELEKPVNPVLKSSKVVSEDELKGELEGVKVEGDVLSHLENLEAEIWAALDDAEHLDVTDYSTTSGGVSVGGAAPASPVKAKTAGERVEVKKTVTPLSSNKKIKVTSVQVNVRRSSRSEDPRKVQSQPQPVKPVLQDPKPANTSNRPSAVSQEQHYVPEPVRLRRPREPVATKSVTVRSSQTTKQERTSLQSRKEGRRSLNKKEIMVDFDSFLEGELASINEVLEQFQSDDKKAKERNLEEEKLLESKNATDGVPLPEVSVEEISRRRQVESQNMEEQWEAEMKRLEEERLRDLQREEELKMMVENDDEVVQNLDRELQSLIAHEVQLVKETQKEKELNLIREQEELERKEREKKERKLKQVENQEELTVEEWISWMEEKKKQGMTPEQQAEYEKRKKAHLEKEKEREIKRKQEIEEKKKKTREMMVAEQQASSQRDSEVKSSRITAQELRKIQEENAAKEAQESQQRKERSKQKMVEIKKREIDEATPKARSALAARWEEKIKSRNGGKVGTTQNKSTVMSDSLEREKQRMARIIAPNSQNGNDSS